MTNDHDARTENESATRLRSLVKPDRVHRSVYTDAAIFDLEMARIWGQAWIYVGHESQVPRAGAFLTTTVGTHPVSYTHLTLPTIAKV